MQNGLILTGAAGFIGINVLLKMNKDFVSKYDVIYSIDKLGYATVYNRNLYTELCSSLGIKRIDCDISQISNFHKFESNIDWDILDIASDSHVDNSIKNPSKMFEDNAVLPSRFLTGFNDLNSIRSYYHISTDEVYGDLPLNVKSKDWFNIDSPFNPSNPYSAAKVSQDAYLMAMKRTFNLPVHIIRMANQFGNFQHPEKMLPASCLRAYKGESIKVYGTGENKRQWTPVDITATIILDQISQQRKFDVLHIANKNGLVSNNDIVDMIVEVIDSNTGNAPQIEYVADRLGHDLCYALKTSSYIDNYFKDINLKNCVANVAEFYFLKKNDFI